MPVLQAIEIDEGTMRRLADRAAAHGTTIEDEARSALVKGAVDPRGETVHEALARIRAMTPHGVVQSDSVKIIREQRDSR